MALFGRKDKKPKKASASGAKPNVKLTDGVVRNVPIATPKRKVDLTIDDEGVHSHSAQAKTIPRSGQTAKTQGRLNLTGGGLEKAARLLIALGPDEASLILREMQESEVVKLVSEMVKIGRIDATEKEKIIAEFQMTVQYFEPPMQGGIDTAREILVKGLGEGKANDILSRISRQDLKKDFEFLEKIEPPVLASALSLEHPQVTAVAMCYIQPKIAAQVIKHLPSQMQTDVTLRIARTSRTHPDSVLAIARVLREKFEKRKDEYYSETGGAKILAGILNHLDKPTEEGLLDLLADSAPDIIEDVKDLLYTFEELMNLTPREMRLLIGKVNDDKVIAAALRGADEELRRHFFAAVSQNRAADIIEEMNIRGPLSTREISEARSFILGIARKLDEEEMIVIKKNKEEYI